MKKLYNLSKEECIVLSKYPTETLGVKIWNMGKAKTIEESFKKAVKIKEFAKD